MFRPRVQGAEGFCIVGCSIFSRLFDCVTWSSIVGRALELCVNQH